MSSEQGRGKCMRQGLYGHARFKLIQAISTVILVILNAYNASAQIVNIEDLRIHETNDSVNWYGSIGAGFNYVRIREEALQLSFDSRAQYKSGKHLWLCLFNAALLRAGNQDFNNNAFGHLRYNYKLLPGWTLEAYAQLQQNRLILLRSRTLSGAGIRWKTWRHSEHIPLDLYLGVSFMYEENIFKSDEPALFATRASSYISWSYRFNERVSLFSTTYFQPVVGGPYNYRALSDWRLSMPVGRKLSINIQYTWTRETYLPDQAPPETVVWRNSLVWRL